MRPTARMMNARLPARPSEDAQDGQMPSSGDDDIAAIQRAIDAHAKRRAELEALRDNLPAELAKAASQGPPRWAKEPTVESITNSIQSLEGKQRRLEQYLAARARGPRVRGGIGEG